MRWGGDSTIRPARRRALRRIAVLCVLALWMAAGLWFGAGPAAAAGSGKDGVIVYAAWPSGNAGSRLYTYNPANGQVVNLSGTTVGDDQPAFSPDGKTIAFRHGSDLWTMNADGSNRKLVLHFVNGTSWPTWSPDGMKLAFAGSNVGQGGYDIWTVNADSSSPHQLTTDHADEHPTWSPNGTSIAFTSRRNGGNPEIYRMNADGTGQTDLTRNTSAHDYEPAFSPDSARIVFTSTRDHSHSIGPDLWTMTVTGTDVREFDHADDYSDGANASYSPDGTQIAFVANIGTGALQLWDAPVGGGTETRLTSSGSVNATNWQQAPSTK